MAHSWWCMNWCGSVVFLPFSDVTRMCFCHDSATHGNGNMSQTWATIFRRLSHCHFRLLSVQVSGAFAPFSHVESKRGVLQAPPPADGARGPRFSQEASGEGPAVWQRPAAASLSQPCLCSRRARFHVFVSMCASLAPPRAPQLWRQADDYYEPGEKGAASAAASAAAAVGQPSAAALRRHVGPVARVPLTTVVGVSGGPAGRGSAGAYKASTGGRRGRAGAGKVIMGRHERGQGRMGHRGSGVPTSWNDRHSTATVRLLGRPWLVSPPRMKWTALPVA